MAKFIKAHYLAQVGDFTGWRAVGLAQGGHRRQHVRAAKMARSLSGLCRTGRCRGRYDSRCYGTVRSGPPRLTLCLC
mgnify:CR=1 FL=1